MSDDDNITALVRRLERDEEKEVRPHLVVTPRRKQFRYWAVSSFRPVRSETDGRAP